MTNLSFDTYRQLCYEHGGEASLNTWLELWRVLHHRDNHGWHFELNGDEPMWAFGLAGEAHLVVQADKDWVTVFDYRGDDVEPFLSITDFESWLPAAERANAGFSPTYIDLRRHIASDSANRALLDKHDEQLRRQREALALE